jgi:hypothetical protein
MARNGHALELSDVRYWINSGKHMLAMSFSGFDPTRASRVDARLLPPCHGPNKCRLRE